MQNVFNPFQQDDVDEETIIKHTYHNTILIGNVFVELLEKFNIKTMQKISLKHY